MAQARRLDDSLVGKKAVFNWSFATADQWHLRVTSEEVMGVERGEAVSCNPLEQGANDMSLYHTFHMSLRDDILDWPDAASTLDHELRWSVLIRPRKAMARRS